VNKFIQCKKNNTPSVLDRSHGLNEIAGFQVQNRRCQMRSRIGQVVSRLDRYILPLIAGLFLSVSAFSQTPGEPAGPYPTSEQTMQFPAKQDTTPVDPQVNLIMDRMLAAQVFHPSNIKDPHRAYFLYPKFAGSAESVFRVEDSKIPDSGGSIPIRLYTPNARTELPLWVSFHGDNAAGGLNTYDVTLPALINRWNCRVVSVECRPAAENHYPAAPDNAYANTKWLAEHPAQIGRNPRTPLSATPLGTFGLPPMPGTPQTPTSQANRGGNIDLSTLAAHFRIGQWFRRQN
jgi:alpha/beta hydrolase fold